MFHAVMLETQRLILRQWRDDDFSAYAHMCAEPKVMRYFPSTLTRQQSDEQANYMRGFIEDNGWGFWAVELKSTGQFIGFVGLLRPDESSGVPNAPLVEVGWRLAAEHWGLGYAPEAATAALAFAFEELSQTEVYAYTPLQNAPSQRVMQKLGMYNTGQDFDLPKFAQVASLQRCCLYRITRQQWQDNTSQLTELARRTP